MPTPEFNVWKGGRWYGPSYPDAGMPLASEEVVTPQGADGPPPKSGAGSSRAKWADYAGLHNVPVGEDDTRDDIVDNVAAAGIPTD